MLLRLVIAVSVWSGFEHQSAHCICGSAYIFDKSSLAKRLMETEYSAGAVILGNNGVALLS